MIYGYKYYSYDRYPVLLLTNLRSVISKLYMIQNVVVNLQEHNRSVFCIL